MKIKKITEIRVDYEVDVELGGKRLQLLARKEVPEMQWHVMYGDGVEELCYRYGEDVQDCIKNEIVKVLDDLPRKKAKFHWTAAEVLATELYKHSIEECTCGGMKELCYAAQWLEGIVSSEEVLKNLGGKDGEKGEGE